MFRQSAAPLSICIFMLASCGGGADDPIPASQDVSPADDPITIDDVTFSVTKESDGATTKAAYGSRLATIPENENWSVTVIASDGRGGTVALTLSDDGNGDSDAFSFDTETGAFSLRTPQDFENPIDADQDNSFEMLMYAHEYPDLPGLPFSIDISNKSEIFENRDTILLEGWTEYRGLGRNAVNLGDIDKDGLPDLVVAAPGQHTRDRSLTFPPEGNEFGEVYVLSGKVLSEAETYPLSPDVEAGVLRIDGVEGDMHFGYSLANIGDLDDDGVNDLVTARNQTELNIISGATLAAAMRTGDDVSLDEIAHARVILPDNYFIDPHGLGAVGDMSSDDVPELAACLRRGDNRTSNSLLHYIALISGAPLKDALIESETVELDALVRGKQAGGYYRSGGVAFCGPLTVIGDINADGLTDVASGIVDLNESSATVYSGAELASSMSLGYFRPGRYSFLSPPAYSTFTDDDVPTVIADRIVTPLGDIDDDGADDFAFGWLFFQDSQNLDLDGAFIVKGHPTIFAANGIDTNKDMRALQSQGNAILLDGPSGAEKLTALSAIVPPEGGLHNTLITARLGFYNATKVYSVLADELPTGGTPSISVPVAGAGGMTIPAGNSINLSQMISIGDLNADGYGDLLIGHDTGDPYNPGRKTDAGMVWLVSGKALLEAREQGREFDPFVAHAAP